MCLELKQVRHKPWVMVKGPSIYSHYNFNKKETWVYSGLTFPYKCIALFRFALCLCRKWFIQTRWWRCSGARKLALIKSIILETSWCDQKQNALNETGTPLSTNKISRLRRLGPNKMRVMGKELHHKIKMQSMLLLYVIIAWNIVERIPNFL